MRFTGTTVLPVENGKIAEEIGLDDGVTALQQLGILKIAYEKRAGGAHPPGPVSGGERVFHGRPGNHLSLA
jgi:hypothetical protein